MISDNEYKVFQAAGVTSTEISRF